MIDDDGLRVTAPRRITLAEIDNAIRAKQRWILTKLHERGERRATREERRRCAGATARSCPSWAATSRCACEDGGAQPLRVRCATRAS